MASVFTDVSSSNTVLSSEVMRDALVRRGVKGLWVEVFDSLPSTSKYLGGIAQQSIKQSSSDTTLAKQLLDRDKQLCVADWQTAGAGRRGKSWVTERGNVTFSLLLPMKKPPAQLLGLSLVTGICVAESLIDQANVEVQLKWPNDVLVDDKKLCGLLTELVSSTSEVTQVVVGVGVNYKKTVKLKNSDYEAISLPMLSQSAPQRETLISDICARLLEAYALFEHSGWSAFADRWDRFDYLKGRQVRVINAGVEEHATAVGVDSSGALLIERDTQTSAVYSAEVSVRLA